MTALVTQDLICGDLLLAEAADQALVSSDEHTAVAFVDLTAVPAAELPAVYRRLVAA